MFWCLILHIRTSRKIPKFRLFLATLLLGSQKGGRNRAMVNATNGNEKVWNINLFAHKSTLNTFNKVELRLALLASMHDLDSLFLLVWTYLEEIWCIPWVMNYEVYWWKCMNETHVFHVKNRFKRYFISKFYTHPFCITTYLKIFKFYTSEQTLGSSVFL